MSYIYRTFPSVFYVFNSPSEGLYTIVRKNTLELNCSGYYVDRAKVCHFKKKSLPMEPALLLYNHFLYGLWSAMS